MATTECQGTTATKLKRIAWLSARNPDMKFDCLMHHFNEESLAACFRELDRKKAVGLDQISKDDYGLQLDVNLRDLIDRMKRMAYIPAAVKEVRIPKEGKPGSYRPLGVSNFEDKVVQRQMGKVLESIYDPMFMECSFGFRPGLGCHDALRALRQHLFQHEVEAVIDVDLENFFGTIDHGILEEFLRRKIGDERFIRYILRMFKSGILSDGELKVSEEGVPQGSCCSPVLANIVAHHVIDEWFEMTVKIHCRGRVAMFRYADDLVICCRYSDDAQRIHRALGKRLARYKLKLNETKTRLVSFSKVKYRRGERQETFDYLGFTVFLSRSKRGVVIPKVKTSRRTHRQKLRNVKEWAKLTCRIRKLPDIWRMFCIKLQGHVNYYGVTFNVNYVRKFLHEALCILFKWLNRRSQKKSFTWEKFNRFLESNPLPVARVVVTL